MNSMKRKHSRMNTEVYGLRKQKNVFAKLWEEHICRKWLYVGNVKFAKATKPPNENVTHGGGYEKLLLIPPLFFFPELSSCILLQNYQYDGDEDKDGSI